MKTKQERLVLDKFKNMLRKCRLIGLTQVLRIWEYQNIKFKSNLRIFSITSLWTQLRKLCTSTKNHVDIYQLETIQDETFEKFLKRFLKKENIHHSFVFINSWKDFFVQKFLEVRKIILKSRLVWGYSASNITSKAFIVGFVNFHRKQYNS